MIRCLYIFNRKNFFRDTCNTIMTVKKGDDLTLNLLFHFLAQWNIYLLWTLWRFELMNPLHGVNYIRIKADSAEPGGFWTHALRNWPAGRDRCSTNRVNRPDNFNEWKFDFIPNQIFRNRGARELKFLLYIFQIQSFPDLLSLRPLLVPFIGNDFLKF